MPKHHRSGAYPVTPPPSPEPEPEDTARPTDPPNENGSFKHGKRVSFPPNAPFWAGFLRWAWESGSVKWAIEKIGIPTILLGLVGTGAWVLQRDWRKDTREDQKTQVTQTAELAEGLMSLSQAVKDMHRSTLVEAQKANEALLRIETALGKRR